jgi:peroxiredoxin Q/BCP
MQQMPELDKYIPEFNKLNVQLLFVAFDPPNQMKAAVAKYHLQTPVLSYNNPNTTVDAAYNLEANSMGMGRRAGHTFVLVGTNGKILWRKDYYQGDGMNGPSTNTMFVNGLKILAHVEKALGNKS